MCIRDSFKVETVHRKPVFLVAESPEEAAQIYADNSVLPNHALLKVFEVRGSKPAVEPCAAFRTLYSTPTPDHLRITCTLTREAT